MMLLLLAAFSAHAADPVILVRRDAKMCEKPADEARCVTMGVLAEPSSAWRDPFVARTLQEKGDWLLIEASSAPSGSCMSGPPLPTGSLLRAWVRKTNLVPATTHPLKWEDEGGKIAIAAGVPVGMPYNGKRGVSAYPFLGTLNVPEDATAVSWVPAPPEVQPPAGSGPLSSNAGVPVYLGDDGNGSILPGLNHGVLDDQWFTVHSRCVVVSVPADLTKSADVTPAEEPTNAPAAIDGEAVTLPVHAALLWDSGKPMGELWQEMTLAKALFTAKGKLACADVLLTDSESRTVHLCVEKGVVGM